MAGQVQGERINGGCLRLKRIAKARDSYIRAAEGGRRHLHPQIAELAIAVLLKRHLLRATISCYGQRRIALEILRDTVQVMVATGPSDDERHGALVDAAREPLIVVDMPGENGIWHTPALAHRVLQNPVHIDAATVKVVEGIDGVVHAEQQRAIRRSGG